MEMISSKTTAMGISAGLKRNCGLLGFSCRGCGSGSGRFQLYSFGSIDFPLCPSVSRKIIYKFIVP